ncbi:glycosyltransferase family 4 protein [Phenylobacterium sp. LjRoot225]|uniref:glycosyltransferase family 4 protein n=1 Tax=Phenylobacterium sp. LjRoot225 TaxID=3342285 RepID=UPI003ED0703F
MTKRECWLVDSSLLSGAYAYHLAEALADQGAAVRLVARPLRPGEELPPTNIVYDPLFYPLGEWAMRFAKGAGRNAAKLVKGLEHALGLAKLVWRARQERPYCVHFSQFVLPALDRLAIRALERTCPVVVTVHNSVPLHGVRPRAVREEDFFAAYRAADAVFAHTETTRKTLLARGVAPDKIHQISHPPLALRQEYEPHARGDAFRVLLWGAIKPYKGVETLLEATARAISTERPIEVRVVGKAFYDASALVARAAEPDLRERTSLELRFMTDAEIDAELRSCDLVVFPYHEIDTSGTFPTSLRYGKAILVSNVGGFAELPLPPDVRRWAVVPPHDPQALAESLRTLAEDPKAYEANVEAFRKLFEGLQTWADVAAKVIEVYREVGADVAGGLAGGAAGSATASVSATTPRRKVVEAAQS